MRTRLIFLLVAFLAATNVKADTTPDFVPAPLKPWVSWVLQREAREECTTLSGQQQCLWPARLALSVDKQGGQFFLLVTTERDQVVSLPGSADAWPLNVRAGSGPIPVASSSGSPVVYLSRGTHAISGDFKWENTPTELKVPKESALVTLKAEGKSISGFTLSEEGTLSLRNVLSSEGQSKADAVSLAVFRRINDGIPFEVQTRIVVSVSEERAQVRLTDPSPLGTRLVAVKSEVPHYQSADGGLVFGLSSGTHTIELLSVGSTPLTEIRMETPPSLWPPEETWMWSENRQLRSATLLGGTPIDPSLAGVPSEWLGLPAVLVSAGKSIKVDERPKTQNERKESALTLQRTFVRDVDGGGYTVADELVGTLGGSGRLDLEAPAELGFAALNGEPQLITLSPVGKKRGVEIRSKTLTLKTTSRLAQTGPTMPVVGWSRDVDWLKVALHSPPGEEVLWVDGADNTAGTRFSAWNLSTIFVLLLVGIVTSRVLGVFPSIAAVLCFSLIHGDQSSLMELFFVAVLGVALLKHEKANRYWSAIWLCLLLLLCAQVYFYAATEVSMRLFPDLSTRQTPVAESVATAIAPVQRQDTRYAPAPYSGSGSSSMKYNDTRIANSVNAVMTYAEGTFGALVMVAAGFMALALAALRQYKVALTCLGVALSAFVCRALTSTFFNDAGIQDGGGSFYESQESGYNKIARERGLEDLGEANTAGNAARAEVVSKTQLTIQAGPGMPQWQGREAILTWNGAVPKDHTITVWYLPRTLAFFLSILKLLLLLVLLRALWKGVSEQTRGVFLTARQAVMPLLVFGMFATTPVAAQEVFPPSSMLDELATRLKEGRADHRPCSFDCVSTESVTVSTAGSTVSIQALVHSVGSNPWALPRSPVTVAFESITIDGKEPEAARREGGVVWLRMPSGVHTVEAKAVLPDEQLVSLAFQQATGRLVINTTDFQTFVDRSGPAPILQLLRKLSKSPGTGPAPSTHIAPWFEVERDIVLTHEGRTSTTVQRIGSTEREDLIEVNLLPGERVLKGGAKQEAGQVAIGFKRGSEKDSFEGIFNTDGETLSLEAKGGDSYSEVWRVTCAEQWRCSFEGLQPSESFEDGIARFTLRPAPGQKSVMHFTKADGAIGDTQSIVSAELTLQPSTHYLKANASLIVRAGQNGSQSVTLPDGVVVRSLEIDGQDSLYLINSSARPLELPIRRGLHTYRVAWQQPAEMAMTPKLPLVEFGVPFTNGSVNYVVPDGWLVVGTSAGRFGPRITVWIDLVIGVIGFLLVSLLIPLPLTRSLSLLMFIGAWWVGVKIGILMGMWLFLCGALLAVSKNPDRTIQDALAKEPFNRIKYLIIGVPPILMAFLLKAAFIAGPDVRLRGVGTTARVVSWYTDRGLGSLPVPRILAIPSVAWQVLLLLWAVFAALGIIAVCRRVLISERKAS